MPIPRHLNLPAIEQLLIAVQVHFAELSKHFVEQRDPLVDQVRQNMLAGYALVDDLVRRDIDLFSLKDFGLMLELNTTVLCGNDPGLRHEFAEHIAATEKRFYESEGGGIGDLLEWYAGHRNESAWKRAAGAYVRILSKPQLFIEGNHRTGSLIASYLLMRDGNPPFVLTVDNAEAFFNPSSVIRNTAKHGARALFELPKIKKKYAAFLEEQSRYLQGTLLEV